MTQGGQLAISEEGFFSKEASKFPLLSALPLPVQGLPGEQSHHKELEVTEPLPPAPPDPSSPIDANLAKPAEPGEVPEGEPIRLNALDMSGSESEDGKFWEEGEQTLCNSLYSDLEGDLVAEGEREMVSISQLTGGTMYRVSVVVQNQRVDAVGHRSSGYHGIRGNV